MAKKEWDGFLKGATAMGLVLPTKMTYERYVENGAVVIAVGRACPRWMADLLIWGEDHLGDKFSQAVSDMGVAPKVAMNLIRVGRAVPPTRRRALLSFAHDEQVATMEPDEQRYWLNKAEKGEDGEPWSSKRLRAELKAAGKAPEALPASDESAVCPTCGKGGYTPPGWKMP